MQVVSPELISGKRVLLRLDFDVPIENGRVVDDFRLKMGLPTLKLCLQYAQEVIILGHIGRPEGREVPELSVAPIYDWLEANLGSEVLENEKLKLLENLRFENGEEEVDLEFAKALASLGEVFINEAFASYHPAASTTVLPTLLPHAAGLRFAQEVERLGKVLQNPGHPLMVIVGGAKVEDKLPVAQSMAQIADTVLIGGKIVSEIKQQGISLPQNVKVADLNESGTDITLGTVDAWEPLIQQAKMIVWNGPVGLIEDQNLQNEVNLGSAWGTYKIAQFIANCAAESIIGGGDTIGFLDKLQLLEKFSFVSTGGGAMLKFLTDKTLPTIEALK